MRPIIETRRRSGARSSRWAGDVRPRRSSPGCARLDGCAGRGARQRPAITTAARGRRTPAQKITRLRRPRRNLPPARRLSVRLPRLHDRRWRPRQRRNHPPRRARDGGDHQTDDALVHGDRAQCRSASPARRISPPGRYIAALRLAVGAVGLAAARGRRSRPPTAPRSTPPPIRRRSSPKSRSG